MGIDTIGTCANCGKSAEACEVCEMPNGRVYHLKPATGDVHPFGRAICGVIRRA